MRVSLILLCFVATAYCSSLEAHPSCSKKNACLDKWQCQKEQETGNCICCLPCQPNPKLGIHCTIPCRPCGSQKKNGSKRTYSS
ncbi:hypothetical protein BY458DRAFT_515736 [Sporodiniella umbellata]|nr:hypothetical protein BY458DRAFT_515736 [Sporodiniella umbellata]